MSTSLRGNTRDGWGVFDEAGFRLQDSPYLAQTQVPFTMCDVGGAAIAMVVEAPRTFELHDRVRVALRPRWIDAIGQTTRRSAPTARIACIDADLIAPIGFDARAFALAASIGLFSHGLFDCVPDRYEVRVGDQLFTFAMTFDDDTELWSADIRVESHATQPADVRRNGAS